MSDIHYFQRYSQRENVVTNNTLQFFALLYRDSPGRLNDLLNGLLDDVPVEIGLRMRQQTKTARSVPDGALTQSSFKLVLETKLDGNAYKDQLERHLSAFEGETQGVLLLLDKKLPDDSLVRAMEDLVDAHAGSVTFAATTFADVINLLRDEIVSEYESELWDLIDDYESFCSGEGLLPKDDVLRAVPCGKSHEDNAAFHLYYAPSDRGYRSHKFVGIYYDKAIRYIGKLRHEVDIDLEDGQLVGEGIEKLSEEERQRVREAIKRAEEERGWGVSGHRFFIVDEFHETEFKKTSKYGMQGTRYFSVRKQLELDESEDLPSTEEIAVRLKEKEWE